MLFTLLYTSAESRSIYLRYLSLLNFTTAHRQHCCMLEMMNSGNKTNQIGVLLKIDGYAEWTLPLMTNIHQISVHILNEISQNSKATTISQTQRITFP